MSSSIPTTLRSQPQPRRNLRAAFLMALAFASAGCTLVPPPAFAQQGAPQGAPPSFADLSERLSGAVVNISATTKRPTSIRPGGRRGEGPPALPSLPPGGPGQEFFDEFFRQFNERGAPGRARRSASLGSGFVIDAKRGYIVTNNHVIGDGDQVAVTLANNRTLKATMVGHDEKTDLAVLKVDPIPELQGVTWGNSEEMRVGDWVLAIGNPFGLGGTVTAGIISARGRNINAGAYDDFLQTDASINRGNSGGPMFNLKGEVIGINTAIFSPTGGSVGIGFAIPSSLARPIVEQLIEFGRTKRGWLGVRFQQVTPDIAESLSLKEAKGALVSEVLPKGPAAAAGLEPGDVITAFDGKPVDASSATLPRMVAAAPVGHEAKLTVLRDGQERSVTIKIGALEEAEKQGLTGANPSDEEELGEETETPRGDTRSERNRMTEEFGFVLSPLTDNQRQRFELPKEAAGLVVTRVEDDSPATDAGLQPGDLVVEVNQAPVKSTADFTKAVEEARKRNRQNVLLMVERKGQSSFRTLAIGDN